jgi:hypothetical protein
VSASGRYFSAPICQKQPIARAAPALHHESGMSVPARSREGAACQYTAKAYPTATYLMVQPFELGTAEIVTG